MNYKEFFEKHKDDYVQMGDRWGYFDTQAPLEDLYQAFKQRFIAEMVEHAEAIERNYPTPPKDV